MTVRKILLMGNPALRVRSQPVTDPRSPDIEALVTDMRDTLESVAGIGLAAPQIGVPLRVVLYCLPANRIPPDAATPPIPWTAMINPIIEPIDDEKVVLWERCLSLPGLYAQVPRFRNTTITYATTEGETVTHECHGYLSTLLQHECDHLDGTLYPMRMPNPAEIVYASEVCGEGGVFRYAAAEFDGR